jgi:hypothetical protein
MKNGEFPAINPKRSWSKEQWAVYQKLPWIGRRLADIMVLTPKVSRWVSGQILQQRRRRDQLPEVGRNLGTSMRKMARVSGLFLLFVPSPALAQADRSHLAQAPWLEDNCGADGFLRIRVDEPVQLIQAHSHKTP